MDTPPARPLGADIDGPGGEGPSNEYSEGPVELEPVEGAPSNEYSEEGALLYFEVDGLVEVGLLEEAPSNEYSDDRG